MWHRTLNLHENLVNPQLGGNTWSTTQIKKSSICSPFWSVGGDNCSSAWNKWRVIPVNGAFSIFGNVDIVKRHTADVFSKHTHQSETCKAVVVVFS